MIKEPVFVYGTLKKGFGLNRVMTMHGSEFLGAAVTPIKYPMVGKGKWFPYLYNEPGVGHNVAGEVYLCSQSCIADLDRIEGVPTHYVREKIAVLVGGKTVVANVYFSASKRKEAEELICEFTEEVRNEKSHRPV